MDSNFVHKTVNHDLYFVDPHSRVHTNSIESKWNSGKIHIKGVSRSYLSSYLNEYIWRCNTGNTRVEASEQILIDIAQQHQLSENFDDDLNNVLTGIANIDLLESDETFDVYDVGRVKLDLPIYINDVFETLEDDAIESVIEPALEIESASAVEPSESLQPVVHNTATILNQINKFYLKF